MSENDNGGRIAAFGPFRFDLLSRELCKNGIRLRLEQKPALVLQNLIENAGAVVTRESLHRLLWPDGVQVDFNHGLNKSINRLRALLGDDRERPRYIETLNRRGYRFVAPLEISVPRFPQGRIADEVRATSNDSAVQIETRIFSRLFSQQTSSSWSRSPTVAGIAVVLGIIILLAGASLVRGHNVAAVRHRPSVAILGFRDLSGGANTSWLSTALSEWLATDLATGGELRLVSTEHVARVRADLGIKNPDQLTAEMLGRVRQDLAADLIVSGYYAEGGSDDPGRVRVDVRLQDGRSGEILAATSIIGSESNPLALASQLSHNVRTCMGWGMLSAKRLRQTEDVMPHDAEAARLYFLGLDELRRFDLSDARRTLTEAASIAPDHALVHSALATAYAELGYSRDAPQEAKRAFDLSSNLPLELRLMIEGQLDEASHDWTGAKETYATLFRHYPDDVEYGLRLAAVQTASGKGTAALDTLQQLQKLPAPAGQDPRIDLAEAEAAGSFSDFKRQLHAAHNAVEKSRAWEARLLVARAEVAEGEAYRSLGSYEDALSLWNDALQKFEGSGDRSSVAAIYVDEGHLRWQQGNHLLDVRESYEKAISISRAIGDDLNLGRALTGLGQFQLYYVGTKESRKTLEEALSVFRRIGNQQEEAYTLSFIADGTREYEEAKALYTKSLELSRAVHDRSRTAGRLMDLGIIATVHGDLSEATEKLSEAQRIYQEIGERNRAALQLKNLAIVFRWEGKLSEAEKSARQAVSTLSSIGEIVTRAQARETLASIQTEAGELSAAEANLLSAIEDYRRAGDDGAVRCLVQLAEIRLAQGRYAESRAVLTNSGVNLLSNEYKGEFSLSPIFLNARLCQIEGNHGKTLAEARRALNLASEMDAGSMQMEARLILAEIEFQGTSRNLGQLHLAQLEQDAGGRGFGLIAQRAREALTRN